MSPGLCNSEGRDLPYCHVVEASHSKGKQRYAVVGIELRLESEELGLRGTLPPGCVVTVSWLPCFSEPRVSDRACICPGVAMSVRLPGSQHTAGS